MGFSKEIEEQIIDLFCNTNIRISNILKKVAPNNEITLEDLYYFLNQYRTKDGDKLTRPGKPRNNKEKSKEYNDEICEEIYEMREKGKTYRDITNILNQKGIKISCSTVIRISDKLYNDKNKIDKRKYEFFSKLETEIYELMKNGMSYEEIKNHFNKKGIEISINGIEYRCRKINKAMGEEQYKYLRKCKTDIDNETILLLRTHGMTYHEISDYYRSNGIKVSHETIRQRLKKIKADNDKVKQNDDTIYQKSNAQTLLNFSKVKNKKELITVMLNVAKKKKATKEQLRIFAYEVSKMYKERIDFELNKQDDEIERE